MKKPGQCNQCEHQQRFVSYAAWMVICKIDGVERGMRNICKIGRFKQKKEVRHT